jgi:hypothetical protein
VQALQVHEWM